MKSMTGYGKGVCSANGKELTVELKSVNHRFLDLNIKMPRVFIEYENALRSVIGEGLSRGHIDVYVNMEQHSTDDCKIVTADLPLAKEYLNIAKTLSDEFGLKNDFGLTTLMRTSEVIKTEQKEEDSELLGKMLITATTQAVVNLNAMRKSEGDKMFDDIKTRVNNIENILQQIVKFAPSVASEHRQKLQNRISEVLADVEVDSNKLLNEVAFFVDKSNIDEEIARLFAHIENCRNILQEEEPIGRKLDFLVQEFNRESNTICSKSNNISLTNLALELKNEVEKVREQVQNIE